MQSPRTILQEISQSYLKIYIDNQRFQNTQRILKKNQISKYKLLHHKTIVRLCVITIRNREHRYKYIYLET